MPFISSVRGSFGPQSKSKRNLNTETILNNAELKQGTLVFKSNLF